MKDILVVAGTAGVGKSTICWEWAGCRRGAAIDCDMLRWSIRNPSLRWADGYQEELLAKHACALAEDCLGLGLDVAMDNVWTPKGSSLVWGKLAGKGRIRVFWLNCSTEENRERDRQRAASKVMGGRADQLQRELDGMDWPDYVH